MAEVVTVVGVRHQHILSACGHDAAFQRVAVALLLYVNNAGAFGECDLHRAVGRAIVGNDHFARDTGFAQAAIALRTQTPTVSCSLRQGITTDNSTSVSTAPCSSTLGPGME